MRTDRFVRGCFLALGVGLLADFALAWEFRLTLYSATSLVGSLTFLLLFVENSREPEAVEWPTSVVVLVGVVTASVTCFVVVRVLARYWPG